MTTKHLAIEQVLNRAERAKSESDFTYFWSMLLAAEALAKTVVLGVVAGIADDKDRHRYRLEHQLVKADGIGEWSTAIEDALTGSASQHLLMEARIERRELTQHCKAGEWQFDAISELKAALDVLRIEAEELPSKSDMKRWFRLFARLRNKTRAHGATLPEGGAAAVIHLAASVRIIYQNFHLFRRHWAHLHHNYSGKYRVSVITRDASDFDNFSKSRDYNIPNGIYVFYDKPRRVNLMSSSSELYDFFYANGGWNSKSYEMLSYTTDDRLIADASMFSTPPGVLPHSETSGHVELLERGNCLSNAPLLVRDYIDRPALESELLALLLDDRRHVITLHGYGGIGKTSVALKVIEELFHLERYEGIIWFSARDVDLQLTGPRPVRPAAVSPEDIAVLYANLVLPEETLRNSKFKFREYFEQQLQKADAGPCLFVFDNFETTQNPVELYNWIENYICLPNKILITTRLREFRGDYPIKVSGMSEGEARKLILQTATFLGILDLLTDEYISELISKAEGHPYIIRILLGEVAKQRCLAAIPKLIAGTDESLTALFERTYAALSPCAQRAFLILAAWNSSVPRLVLEVVLFKTTGERAEVEDGIESLLQFSIAETHMAPVDKQEFIRLPLVASTFGRKKLNVSPSKAAIQADVEILQMLGPSRSDDIRLSLARKIEDLLRSISKRLEAGDQYEMYKPMLDSICQAYSPGWYLIARLHMEQRTGSGYQYATEALRRFLESAPEPSLAAEAWKLLGHACYQTGDALGEVHAFVERAQFADVPFQALANTANRLNLYLKEHGFDLDRDQKRDLSGRLLSVMDARLAEADADGLSRMAWLAIQCGKEEAARGYVQLGRGADPNNYHLVNLAQRFGMTT